MATRCCTKRKCGAGRTTSGRIKKGYKLTAGGRLVRWPAKRKARK